MYASLQLQGQTATTQELPSEINGKKAQAGATTLQLAMPGIPNAISVWIIDTPFGSQQNALMRILFPQFRQRAPW
jgi:hypothetical protein